MCSLCAKGPQGREVGIGRRALLVLFTHRRTRRAHLPPCGVAARGCPISSSAASDGRFSGFFSSHGNGDASASLLRAFLVACHQDCPASWHFPVGTGAAPALGSEARWGPSLPLAQTHTPAGAAPLQRNKMAALEKPSVPKMSLFPSVPPARGW